MTTTSTLDPENNCCSVPKCKSSPLTTSNKIFFPVPPNKQLRDRWQKAMGRPWKLGDRNIVCEDHFELMKDTRNYMYCKLMGKDTVKLNVGVIPHKFNCQNFSHPYHNNIMEEDTKVKVELELDDTSASTPEFINSHKFNCQNFSHPYHNNILEEETEVKVELDDISESTPEFINMGVSVLDNEILKDVKVETIGNLIEQEDRSRWKSSNCTNQEFVTTSKGEMCEGSLNSTSGTNLIKINFTGRNRLTATTKQSSNLKVTFDFKALLNGSKKEKSEINSRIVHSKESVHENIEIKRENVGECENQGDENILDSERGFNMKEEEIDIKYDNLCYPNLITIKTERSSNDPKKSTHDETRNVKLEHGEVPFINDHNYARLKSEFDQDFENKSFCSFIQPIETDRSETLNLPLIPHKCIELKISKTANNCDTSYKDNNIHVQNISANHKVFTISDKNTDQNKNNVFIVDLKSADT